MHGRDASRDGNTDPFPRRLDHLVLGGTHVRVAKAPGALLAQHTCGLAALVPLDDAACDLEVAVRLGEGR